LLKPRLLDLPYLLGNELLALHVATQLRQRIGRGLALGRVQVFQALRRLVNSELSFPTSSPSGQGI
jgi:hypothetical protein